MEVAGKTFKGVIDKQFLQRFATEQGALTYTDDPFLEITKTYTERDTFVPNLIDKAVQLNGQILFNLKYINVDDALSGEDTSWAAAELRYIAGNPVARAITTFFNGTVPF
jgi:hypothetical protein